MPPSGAEMDSQGRKVVVCDNGTGVSVGTGTLPELAPGSPPEPFAQKAGRSGNRKLADRLALASPGGLCQECVCQLDSAHSSAAQRSAS